MNSPNPEITRLLQAWRSGDDSAVEQLFGLVYEQLRTIAARYMHRERPDHTLRTTALVHEAYLRLLGSEVDWVDRSHFLAVSSLTMRRILVDHARTNQRQKRGSNGQKLSLDDAEKESALRLYQDDADILDLNLALERLEKQDQRKAKLLELIYFGGLNYEEAALVLTVSTSTVSREARFARAWLRNELDAIATNRPPNEPRAGAC